ncbi:MAG: phosphopantetheine-binding protein [Ruthenibacterium sp.]
MKERVNQVLYEINPEIVSYAGDDLLHDGIIDSFDVVEIAEALEAEFDFEIDAEDVVRDNFCNALSIVQLVQTTLDKQ